MTPTATHLLQHLRWLLAGLLCLTLSHPAWAAPASSASPQTLAVGVFESPPFVMGTRDRPTGLAIDLWEEIAARERIVYQYHTYTSMRALIDAVQAGQVGLAVTSLTINEQRAQRMDFSQPWFEGGMRLLVRRQHRAGMAALLEGLRDAGYLRVYGWIALAILLLTVLLTLFDRHFDPQFPRRWRDGLAESFYAAVKIATSGQAPGRVNRLGWPGRVWQGVWILPAIVIVAFVTSSITSVLTTQSLHHQINSLQDVKDQTVGVLAGTVEEDHGRALGLALRSYDDLGQASAALVAGEVQAVMADAPMLEYYAHTHPEIPVKVVGRLFNRDRYGFALPLGSPLTRAVTLNVLRAIETGRVEQLRLLYFGDVS